MARLLHPLLLLVARATEKELVRYVEYLKAENRILRGKLPKRITVTLAERAKLVKLGLRLGPAIKKLIAIVHPQSFARWIREMKRGRTPGKAGRPRKPEEIRELILRMAKDIGWGTKRILGELRKLCIRNISRSTVRRILQDNGFEPGPERGRGTWYDFVQRHFKTLWACDFFTTKVWTLRGPVTFYVLFFIHVHTRRVHIAGMTTNPDGTWMAQQARNLGMFFGDLPAGQKPTYIVRDRDTKFTTQFCSILENDGIQFVEIAARSPNMNPFAERWIQSIRRECLDHFFIFGEKHLRFLLKTYLDYYLRFRPHQGVGNVTLPAAQSPPAAEPESTDTPHGEVVCQEWLGGLLRHYERRAA